MLWSESAVVVKWTQSKAKRQLSEGKVKARRMQIEGKAKAKRMQIERKAKAKRTQSESKGKGKAKAGAKAKATELESKIEATAEQNTKRNRRNCMCKSIAKRNRKERQSDQHSNLAKPLTQFHNFANGARCIYNAKNKHAHRHLALERLDLDVFLCALNTIHFQFIDCIS
jgi:hypothetical protein